MAKLQGIKSRPKATEGEKPTDTTAAPANAEAEPAEGTATEEPPVEETEADKAKRAKDEEKAQAMSEKARIKGIMSHAEAKGRETLAEHLAYDTDMTAEAAVAILSASPKATVEPPKGNAVEDARQALDDVIKAAGGNPAVVGKGDGASTVDVDTAGVPTTADGMLAAILKVGKREGLIRSDA